MRLDKIISMVNAEPFYNESENMEIAKGKYEYTLSFREVFQKIKRELKFKRHAN